ncbi:Unconventional prefoldin RPB5 interactor [Gracilariopsis chorda]|uniref:Unconventional prefoldin RPB5 interactor n=1 Tax=Gracilariopsis chorda TaxID=448386 RepID=A0A2V3IP55_9FLOR|nr:Unconventional prefoldin RPB5 interactor [Gracilariopsis chorda]|eukprot:PXF43871.1 Unconventional prefoldin RPB5 interactor [Gracilariopsis chorda]
MTTASVTPQTELPSSERSVHERLMALESKQLAYRSLSRRLLELPRKLRRRALVPVAPRLYLPGELVRTNEILVLLGSAGEATYFAERSAWQAHEIVRRRLGRVERGLRELLDEMSDECMIGYVNRNRNTNDESNPTSERIQEEGASVSAEQQSVRTDQDEGDNRDSDTGISQTSISASTDNDITDVSARAQPASVLSKHPKHPNTVAKKKRVTFREPLTSPSLNASPQKCFISPPKTKAKSQKKKKKPQKSASSSEAVKERSSNAEAPNEMLFGDQQHHEEGPPDASASGKNDMQIKMVNALQRAVVEAQQQAMEDGIVNFTEVYEGDEDTPSRVELPAGFEPDENVSFADDSQEYLDVTGVNGNNETEQFSREEYFEALIQAERDAQIEEEQAKVQKQTTELEREKKEFGKGFSKGFFGAAPKKPEPAKTEQSNVGEPLQAETPSTQITESAASEAVVERKPSRKSRRRNRRPRTSTGASPSPMSTALLKQEEQARMDIELLGDEAAENNDEPTSMFRRLRNLQRDAT